jgi:hypothetical protein
MKPSPRKTAAAAAADVAATVVAAVADANHPLHRLSTGGGPHTPCAVLRHFLKVTDMNHVDPELKTYAENGLRSAEDWAAMGRQLKDGVNARTQITYRSKALLLYGRDQTRMYTKPAETAPAIASVASAN